MRLIQNLIPLERNVFQEHIDQNLANFIQRFRSLVGTLIFYVKKSWYTHPLCTLTKSISSHHNMQSKKEHVSIAHQDMLIKRAHSSPITDVRQPRVHVHLIIHNLAKNTCLQIINSFTNSYQEHVIRQRYARSAHTNHQPPNNFPKIIRHCQLHHTPGNASPFLKVQNGHLGLQIAEKHFYILERGQTQARRKASIFPSLSRET